MRIALVHNARFPVHGYGGTERLVWWLAKGLSQLGHEVVLVAAPGSRCPYASQLRIGDFSSANRQAIPGVDLEHHFATPPSEPSTPYLVTVGGNGKPGEVFYQNTCFVSRNHAERHGSQVFVYNGIDPDDYHFSENKEDYLVFLAKAAWRVKNVTGAIRIARASRKPLRIIGGRRWWLPHFRGVHWLGMLGGVEKSAILAKASGLLFPVLWHEPFGIAVVESLVSGTPVIASPFGSLPELITPEVGRICGSYGQMLHAVESLSEFKPKTCRDYAVEKFHYLKMAGQYVKLYERIASGERVNAVAPHTHSRPQVAGGLLSLSD